VPGVEIYALKHVLGSEQATVSYLSALTEALLGINFPQVPTPIEVFPALR
jgi:hypothetical protein